MPKIDELKNRLQHALDINGKKAADLCRDLNIPKSAISQYLSGKSKNMTVDRLSAICKYLDVQEAWMMGYNIPMQRNFSDNRSAIDDLHSDQAVPDPQEVKLKEMLAGMSETEKLELLDYMRYLVSKRSLS